MRISLPWTVLAAVACSLVGYFVFVAYTMAIATAGALSGAMAQAAAALFFSYLVVASFFVFLLGLTLLVFPPERACSLLWFLQFFLPT